ncbi:hypothetical protein V8E54_004260 [Elaphomyces granulatus]
MTDTPNLAAASLTPESIPKRQLTVRPLETPCRVCQQPQAVVEFSQQQPRRSILTFTYNGLATKVQFSTARAGKNVVWKRPKRLITGSIVALSPAYDHSRSQCVVAVVAARPLEGKSKLPRFFSKLTYTLLVLKAHLILSKNGS